MIDKDVIKAISQKYTAISLYLSEKSRRIWVATEAQALGYGGVAAIAIATGVSRPTIYAGLRELDLKPDATVIDRKSGAGRKADVTKNPKIIFALKKLLDPATRGDPESALMWTCKSTQNLADQLNEQGYKISPRSISNILTVLGYSLQSNNKRLEGTNHPDRDAQFKYIYKKVKKFQKDLNPIISVDAKKKEMVGNYKNNGKE